MLKCPIVSYWGVEYDKDYLWISGAPAIHYCGTRLQLPQRAIVALLGRATFLKAEKTMLALPCASPRSSVLPPLGENSNVYLWGLWQ